MPNIAAWNPPVEIFQLGEPDRAYWSRRLSRRFLWTTGFLVVLCLALEGVLLFVAAFTSYIPWSQQYLVYVLSTALLGFAGATVANAFWWGNRRPQFVYAFYPCGLVILSQRKWGYIPWKDVIAFERKYEEPFLALEGRVQYVLVHDFPPSVAEDLYADLDRYVEAKRRVVEELPITNSLVRYDRGTRRQLLVGAALLGITLAVGLLHLEYFDIVLTPDRFVTDRELAVLTQPDELPRSWVTIDCPKVVETRGQITSRREHVTFVESKIVLIPVAGRYLIANVRNSFEGDSRLRGEISRWDQDGGKNADQKRRLLEEMREEFPQYQDQLLPVQFDATAPVETTAQLVVLISAMAFVVGTGLLCRGVVSARNSRPRVQL